MTEVPKIVYDRLRAARSEQALREGAKPEAHPGADLLAAFAEQGLSATERDGVLEHLAFCGDCREVIALALPAAEIGSHPAVEETDAVPQSASRPAAGVHHKPVFAWPHAWPHAWPQLRWAALAAVVLAAGSVLLLHPGKLNQAKLPSANPNSQIAANLPPTPGPQAASSLSSPPPSSSPLSSLTAAAPTGHPVEAAESEARMSAEPRSSRNGEAGRATRPSPPAQSGMLLAGNRIAANKKASEEADKVPAAPFGAARAFEQDASAVPSSSEAVETTAESTTVQAPVSSREFQTAPAIAKAKPATPSETSQLQNNIAGAGGRELPSSSRSTASMARSTAPTVAATGFVTFVITAGVLQRSLDSGQSWQDALRSDHPLLCYASQNAEVWTGGQAGTLFHSVDNGVTWVQVHAAIQDQLLTADITRIELREHIREHIRDHVPGPVEIVVSTSNRQTWTSLDAGRTWKRH